MRLQDAHDLRGPTRCAAGDIAGIVQRVVKLHRRSRKAIAYVDFTATRVSFGKSMTDADPTIHERAAERNGNKIIDGIKGNV